jgi:hypothetical protein
MKTLALLFVPVLCVVCASARGDDPPRPPEKEVLTPLREQYLAAAKKYEFFLDKDRKVPLVFEPKSILHWTMDNDYSGDVFVWMAHGRPQVVGCMLSSPGKTERAMSHEFHSFATEPIGSAKMTANYTWEPKAGLEFRKLDGAPGATAAARLPQMRAISRDLHAFMDAADGKWELRLLPQPLFRYQPADGPVVDGALFAWVWTKGTDPELIVAIECHRTAKGLEWRYAPARFTNREVWLKHDDKEIWRVPVHREGGNTCTGIYTTRYVGKIPVAPKKDP